VIGLHPTEKVSEQVSRNSRHKNTTVPLSIIYTAVRSAISAPARLFVWSVSKNYQKESLQEHVMVCTERT